jgi:hypothetical protein
MLSISEQKRYAVELKELWTALTPCSPPDNYTFMNWSLQEAACVRRAIVRAAAKFKKMSRTETPMSADYTHRYAYSVIKHELQEKAASAPVSLEVGAR